MTDYLLTLQFVKHKSIDKTASLLEKILDYLKQIFMMIGLEMFPSQPQPQEININEAQRINENFN
jgi:hypothetical protein